MKNLISSWFRSVLAFENSGPIQNEYSVIDPTSADGKSLSTLILAVDPSTDGTAPTMVSLRFDGSNVKLFEKKYQDDLDAETQMQSMAKDLEEAASLSKENKIDEAKNLMSSLIEKYKRVSDNLTQAETPLTNTQANLTYKGFQLNKEGDGSWNAILTDRIAVRAESSEAVKAKVDNIISKAAGKTLKKEAGVTMQNLFFDSVDEAMDFQEKTKVLQGPEGSEEGKPLWEQMGNEEVAPSNNPDEDTELAPSNLGPKDFKNMEKDKAKSDKDIGKRIKDQVKTEVESALEQKSASVFGKDQEELVEALRKNGRNWDEVKKILVKDFNYNEDDTTVFLDSLRQKEEGGTPEGLPMLPKPPEDLVSPETHDKLVKEIEDKSEPKPMPKPLEDEIARADNAEIRKVAREEYSPKYGVEQEDNRWYVVDETDGNNYWEFKTKAEAVAFRDKKEKSVRKPVSSLNLKALNPLQEPPAVGQTPGQPLSSNKKVAGQHKCEFCKKWIPDAYWERNVHLKKEHPQEWKTIVDKDKKEASQSKVALNPLQEPPAIGQTPSQPLSAPVEEAPTFDSPVPPSQDSNPDPEFLEAPAEGDRVYVMGDYETGQNGYEGTMGSEFTSKGDEYATVYMDDGVSKEVALHRVVKASQKKVAKAYYEKKASGECSAPDITWDNARGYQCLNCGAKSSHGYDIKHDKKKNPQLKASTDKTADYQGYSNYDTWGLSLWLDNEKDLYDLSRTLAQEIKDPNVLAKNLQGNFGDLLEEKGDEDKSSANVNWLEVANDLLAEVKETEEYEKSQSAETAIESLPMMDVEKEKDILLDQLAKETDPEKKKSLEQKYKRLSMASLNSIKEAALKIQAELEHEGEIALYFHKEGLEKQASGDSAFESNGWCRVWIQDDEIASDAKYSEILKIADENKRIIALKDLARDLAHQALRLADSAANKVGVQAWFESLKPSDHDNIDWVALASSQTENVESAQNSKIEKKAEDDEVSLMMAYEDGQLDNAGILKLFSMLIKNGHVWSLQGGYGRAAKALIEGGYLDRQGNILKEVETEASQKYAFKKQAAEPLLGPTGEPLPSKPETPTNFKVVQKAPSGTDREKAVPATVEQAQLVKDVESSLSSLEAIQSLVKQAKTKLDDEIRTIEEKGGRVQLELNVKQKVDQLSKLVEATQNKMIAAGDTMVRLIQETKNVPFKPSEKWKMEKLTERLSKYEDAAAFLKKAEDGAQHLATTEDVRDLRFFPAKTSKLSKKANFLDSIDAIYNDVLEALKLIIGSEQTETQPAQV